MGLAGMSSALLAAGGLGTFVPTAGAVGTHADPKDLPVPFSGSPWYIELAPDNGSISGSRGGAVADYGSHFGFKANLYENLPLYMGNVAAVAHSLGGSPARALGGKFDRSYFELLNEDDERVALERSVHFEPWGWTERLEAPGHVIDCTALIVSEDAHLLLLDIRGKPARLRMRVYADERTEHMDSFNEYEGSTQTDASFDEGRNELRVDRGFQSSDPSVGHIHRIYRFSEPITDFSRSPGVDEYSFEVTTAQLQGHKTVSVLLGWGLTEEQAAERTDAAAEIVDEHPHRAVSAVEHDWHEFFAALPRPKGGHREQKVYRLANAALRMNLYAPRGDMPMWGAVPNKGHYNSFFGWDTGLQGIGYREWVDWDPSWIDQSRYTIAEQQLLLQLRACHPSGQIPQWFYEDVTNAGEPVHFRGGDEPYACDPQAPVYLNGRNQPAVQGWAAWEVARGDPDVARRRRFLDEAYPVLTCNFEFWRREKDADSDGIVEYSQPGESGWDDTPRLPRDGKAREAVDASAWLGLNAESLARIAKELGKTADVSFWQEQASDLAKGIEETFWNEQFGGWQDRDGVTSDAPFQKFLTPAMWWPAFTGSVTDEAHAQRAIEEHLLDSKEFNGRFPIPSVAYNDPAYDSENDGRYWQGQIWLVCTYASLVALERYGYRAEADQILDRTVAMMDQFRGVYENYDALSGKIGVGPANSLTGTPAVFQFGWTAALISQALLGRHREVASAESVVEETAVRSNMEA